MTLRAKFPNHTHSSNYEMEDNLASPPANDRHLVKPAPRDPVLASILSAIESELVGDELSQFQTIYRNILKLHPNIEKEDIERLCMIICKIHDLPLSQFMHFTSSKASSPRGFTTNGKTTFIHAKEKGGAKKVGQGGFKDVFRAFHVDFNTFEIKEIIHKKGYKRFSHQNLKKEAEIQKKFHDHPNVEKLYGTVEYSSEDCEYRFALYTEKCDGTMEDVLLSKIPMSFNEKLHVMTGTASALAFMHLQGQCHNDIKPDNILIKDKQAKLTDFGLSAKAGTILSSHFTKTLAPEQKIHKAIHHTQPIGTFQTDVFQFGFMLYQTFHPNPENLFAPWPIDTLADQEIQELIKGCLAEDPADRPAMALVQKKLEDIQKESAS